MKTGRSFRRSALAVSVALLPVTAIAQERSTRLEEVIVSAQKRVETQQDVPVSITALSSDLLETAGIQDITDLQARVPSMVVGQLYGSNLITLRGISTGLTSGLEDASVAVHLDGVYQARSRSIDVAMMDLERVEVLAGPQGTLYGRNATGGVVNYITKAPSTEYEGSVTLGAGNYDTQTVKATVSGPVTDQLRFRLSAMYDDQDEGFTENLAVGAPRDTFEDKKTTGARLSLAYEPTDTFQVDLALLYIDTETSSFFAPLAPSIDPTSFINILPQTTEPHKIYSNVDGVMDSILQQAALTLTWDLTDSTQLRSITSYQGFSDFMAMELDGTPLEVVGVYQYGDSETITQEFNLNTLFFDDRLASVFGVFYFDDQMDVLSNVNFFTDPFFGGTGIAMYNIDRQNAKSYSAFTDQTFELTDRIRLLGGLRFNRDEKDIVSFAFCPQGTRCALQPFDESWDAWTSKLGVQFDLTDNVMVYGQYQRGFKSGGFAANSGGDGYDPEKISGPEIGIKSTLLDQRMRLNAAAWRYEYTNLQVQQIRGVGQFSVENAAEATLTGAEVSLEFKVTPNFSVDLAAMVQEAKYDKFDNCNPYAFVGACNTPSTLGLTDVSDNWLNRAPPYTANLGLQYIFDLPNGAELLVRGESYWSGEVFYDEFNSEDIRQEPYSVQNAFVTYTSAGGGYLVRGFVRNIGDEEYIVSAALNSPVYQQTGNWAPPRTYGAEVTFRF